MALSFEEDLRQVINRHSAESVSGTPDFILAHMLTEFLKAFNQAVVDRAEWRGESCELPALTTIKVTGGLLGKTKEDNASGSERTS